MKKLYAPWRHDYINRYHDTEEKKDDTEKGCVFCNQFKDDNDDKYFILKRFSYAAVMMNFYPYNVGHLMVLPFEHQGDLHRLAPHVRAELMEVVALSVPILESTLNAEGFNIGINLGIAGGGGIPSHVHIHILPRWLGDTNFLESIGQVKVLSSDFHKTFSMLKKKFIKI